MLVTNDGTGIAESLFIYRMIKPEVKASIPIVLKLVFLVYTVIRVICMYFTVSMLVIAALSGQFYRNVADLTVNFVALLVVLDLDNLLVESIYFKRFRYFGEDDEDLFEIKYNK